MVAGAAVDRAADVGLAEALPDGTFEGPVSPKLNFNGPVEFVEVAGAVGAGEVD